MPEIMPDMQVTQEAFNHYNFMWRFKKTRDLYAAATAGYSPSFGCAIQDQVLNLLSGLPAQLFDLPAAAQEWINWMLTFKEGDE